MSYSNIHLHIVYATKNRARTLDQPTIERLVKYTGGIIRNMDGILLIGNGVEDHLHLLVTLPPLSRPTRLRVAGRIFSLFRISLGNPKSNFLYSEPTGTPQTNAIP